jgi:hypothetical protein
MLALAIAQVGPKTRTQTRTKTPRAFAPQLRNRTMQQYSNLAMPREIRFSAPGFQQRIGEMIDRVLFVGAVGVADRQ